MHRVNDVIQPSHPLLPPSPPALHLSQYQGLFQWTGSVYQVAKGLELQHQSLPMNIQGWFPLGFDLLAVQGTLKSRLQHHNLKASILRHSAFFMVQLSHPYMTTVKAIALTRWTFVSKMVFLLFFNMLSRFAIAFLPRSNRLLISWLQSSSIVILEPKKIKSVTASTFSPSICYEAMEPEAVILCLECWGFFFTLFHPHQEDFHIFM